MHFGRHYDQGTYDQTYKKYSVYTKHELPKMSTDVKSIAE